jgi:hypothetical protein
MFTLKQTDRETVSTEMPRRLNYKNCYYIGKDAVIHDLHSPSNCVMSRPMKCSVETESAYRMLLRKPRQGRLFGRRNQWWQDEDVMSPRATEVRNKKKTPWSESASKLYRPSDRRLSAKWLPTFADRGCHVISVTDPYGSILGFLDRSRYFSIK